VIEADLLVETESQSRSSSQRRSDVREIRPAARPRSRLVGHPIYLELRVK